MGYDRTQEVGLVEDQDFMALALELAREAAQAGEVPVGCVVALGEEAGTAGRRRKTPCATRSWRPSTRPAGR